MRRVLAFVLILPVLVFLVGGCSDNRKQEVSTQLKELPKEGPKPVGGGRRGESQ
jgi:hypothetical protein